MMMHQKAPTQGKATATATATAKTKVIWDIRSCPVRTECDARRVGPCIKRGLENLGYSGSVTITALGNLIGIPDNILRTVSSTGIALCHIAWDHGGITAAMLMDNPRNHSPQPNILFISARNFYAPLKSLQNRGCNILPMFMFNVTLQGSASSLTQNSTEAESLWKSFLADTMVSEEKCSETSECEWSCIICRDNAGNVTAGQGFESFSKHRSSQKHVKLMSSHLPKKLYGLTEEEVEASIYSPNATSVVNKKPKRICENQRRECKKQKK